LSVQAFIRHWTSFLVAKIARGSSTRSNNLWISNQNKMSVLTLASGEYKDFDCLYVAYSNLPDGTRDQSVLEKIKAASIMAGLRKLTKKEERAVFKPRAEALGFEDAGYVLHHAWM